MSVNGRNIAILDKFFLIKLREENPHLGYQKLANIMEERLKRSVSKTSIRRILNKKVDLLNSIHLKNTQKSFRVKLSLHNEFEKCLKSEILEQYKTCNIYFGMVQKIARAIMKLPPFNNNDKMIKKFSRTWFIKFQQNHGISYRRCLGTKNVHPTEDIDTEVARIREIIKDYESENVWNTDERESQNLKIRIKKKLKLIKIS